MRFPLCFLLRFLSLLVASFLLRRFRFAARLFSSCGSGLRPRRGFSADRCCSKRMRKPTSDEKSTTSGVLCAIVSHPADNLVSFLNNAKGATVGDAVKKIGLVGLFTRGLPLRIVMIGTLTGAQWGIYDAFKVFVGLPTTGGPVALAAVLAAEAKA